LWYGGDVQLAASVVIIQPSTSRFVVLSETRKYKSNGVDKEFTSYFLPRGRKDVGESIEQTALREGYEESGYRCTFLPLDIETCAPLPPGATSSYPNTEPFFVQLIHNRRSSGRHRGRLVGGTEYICFYYIAQIPEDAVPETGTKMWDEQGYVTHLLPLEEALSKLFHSGDRDQYLVLYRAAEVYEITERNKVALAQRESKGNSRADGTEISHLLKTEE